MYNEEAVESSNFWSRFIGRKFNSLKRGKAVHVVLAEDVVGLLGVDDEQSRSPERALRLDEDYFLAHFCYFLEVLFKRPKMGITFWLCFKGWPASL